MKKVIAVICLAAAVLVLAPAAGAYGGGKGEKVTICHRTNSVTNPYTSQSVSKSAVDGEGKNDHSHHAGPVFDFDADPDVAYPKPRNGDQWGDIIPGVLNWDAEGQAIYNNGCKKPSPTTTTPTTKPPKPTTTTTQPTPTTEKPGPTPTTKPSPTTTTKPKTETKTSSTVIVRAPSAKPAAPVAAQPAFTG